MLECEPGAYCIQLKYCVDNYDIKMYLKNIRASEVAQTCSTSQNKPEPLPILFSIKVPVGGQYWYSSHSP